MKTYKIQSRLMLVAFIAIISLIGFSAKAQAVSSYSENIGNKAYTNYLLNYDKDLKIVIVTRKADEKIHVMIQNSLSHEKVEISISQNGIVLAKEYTDREKSFDFDMYQQPEGIYVLSIKAQGKITEYAISTNVQTVHTMSISPLTPQKDTVVVTKQ